MSGRLRTHKEELESEHNRLLDLNSKLQEKIQEREQAEAALRQSESRFRDLTENIDEVLWMMTPDHSKVLYISPTYETVWGRTTQSLRENPQSFLDAIHPEDREWVEGRIVAERSVGFSLEYRIVLPDGNVRWIWDRGFPIKDQSGVIQRLAGIA